MSTLTQQRPSLGGALLLLLFFIVLMAALPPWSDKDPRKAQATSGDPGPPPPNWHWGNERKYGECPGKAIEHILCRHGKSSKRRGGKFKTNDAIELRRWIETAMREGERFQTDTGWRVVYDLGKKIGKNRYGSSSSEIEILLSKTGELLTAYPI